MLARRPAALRRDQLHVDATGQPGGDLILHVEKVGAPLVEAFGPQMRPALGIDELRVEAHPLARVLHAPFEHVSHAEVTADLTAVDRLALIGERDAARDREDAGAAREVGGQRFGDAVGKVIVLRVTANVEKGQDHNRKPGRGGLAGHGRGCGLAS